MQKRNIRSAEQRTQTICLLILSAIGIGVALLHLRQVLLPFVLALFLSMAVTPVLEFMREKFRLPRGMAIGVTIGIASLVLVFLGGLVSAALSEVVEKDEIYIEQVNGLVAKGEEQFQFIKGKVGPLLDIFFGENDPEVGEGTGSEAKLGAEEIQLAPDGTIPVAASSSGDPWRPEMPTSSLNPSALADFKSKIPNMVGQAIAWAANSGLALLSQGLLVLIFTMFLVTGYRSPDEIDPTSLRHQVRSRVKEYLRVKIISSTLTGFATYLVLRIFGVDLAMVFGLMAFFLNFIPNIGSAVAILLPAPVILLAPAESVPLVSKLLAFGLPMGVQFLVGSVLEPRWMGKSLDLSPVAILLSLIFWGVLWGPVGMLLSVPITAVIKMLLERSELTQPVAVLLSDDG